MIEYKFFISDSRDIWFKWFSTFDINISKWINCWIWKYWYWDRTNPLFI